MFLFLILAVQIVIIILIVFLNKKYWNSKVTNYQIALFVAFIFYISILLITIMNIYHLSHKVDAFDLNFDGRFSLEEKSLQQQEALRRLQKAYEGKNKALILGPIIAIVYFLIIIIPLKVFNKKEKLNEKHYSKHQ